LFETARIARDGLLSAVDLLKRFTFINATTKMLFDLITQRKAMITCRNYFIEPYSNRICTDPDITIERYPGALLWVSAYYREYQVDPIEYQFDARQILMKKLGMTDFNEFNNLIAGGMLNTTLTEVQTDLAKYCKCYRTPCDKKYLGELQFFKSGVSNARQRKYPSLKVQPADQVLSIAFWIENNDLLGTKIPEIQGFYDKFFNYKGKVFGSDMDRIFNNEDGRRSSKQDH
jgi:hypothetical protein